MQMKKGHPAGSQWCADPDLFHPLTSLDDVSRVSFMVAIVDSFGNVKRILIGRTTLDSNPLTLPLIESLNSMRDLDGSGMLLNENNHPIYHSDKSQSLDPI